MPHLRSINPAIAVLLLLAGGLAFAAFSLAGGGTPKALSGSAGKDRPAGGESSKGDLGTSAAPVKLPAPGNEFIGVTVAREAIEVAAPSEGLLEAVYVDLGDQLKRGALIARLNSDSINQQLEMARSSLLATEADERRISLALTEAEDRFSRRRSLAAQGLLSTEEVVAAELQVKMAVANLDAAKARIAEQQARVHQIKDSVSKSELRAPFAGTVAARLANPGSTLHSGAPVISLIREGDLWIRFAAPPDRSAVVNIGSVITVTIEAIAGETSATTAVVEHVAPTVDAVSQLLFFEARLKIPAEWRPRIKPGLTAKCRAVR